jgi:hypothetical protein
MPRRQVKENKPTKNSRFGDAFIAQFREDETQDKNLYVGRVLRKFGNGRIEVFFMDNSNRATVDQAIIRGVFRGGRGKEMAFVDVNSIVIMADNEVSGAKYTIVSVLNSDQIKIVKKEMCLDARIFALDNTDREHLLRFKAVEEDGITFDADESEEEDEEEKRTGDKKNKPTKHSKLLAKEELDDGDIDNI